MDVSYGPRLFLLRPTPTRPEVIWHSREIRTLEVTPYDPAKGTLELRLGGPPQLDGDVFVYVPPGFRPEPPESAAGGALTHWEARQRLVKYTAHLGEEGKMTLTAKFQAEGVEQ